MGDINEIGTIGSASGNEEKKQKTLQIIDSSHSFTEGERDASQSNLSKKANFFIGDPDVKLKILDKNDVEIDPNQINEIPDGGLKAWLIVFASFICNFIVDGIIFTFGVMVNPIKEAGQGKLQVTSISWIGSLLAGFYLVFGPFVSAISNRFGFRFSVILGSLMASSGVFLSWYLNKDEINILSLFFLYGVLGGIGFGLIYIPSIVTVGFYFEKKRALATGIAIAGSGIGTFCLAPTETYIQQNYGWDKVFLFQGSLILICSFVGLLFKPLSPPKQTAANNDASKDTNRKDSKGFSIQGTPLMIRIKRAREMERRDDSAASLENGNKVQRPRVPVKRSSFPLTGVGEHSSAPVPIPAIKGGKVKSFGGLPHEKFSLNEITEESEHNSEGNANSEKGEGESLEKLESMTEMMSTFANASQSSNMYKDGNENTNYRNRNRHSSSGTTYTLNIGNSVLTLNEMDKSRILRVDSTAEFVNRPMFRDDAFFAGSLKRIPEYKQNVDNDNAFFSSREWSVAVTRANENETCKFCPAFINKMLDFSLLLSPTFCVLALSGTLTMSAFFVPFIYLSGLANQLISEDSFKINFLLSIIGISNTVGRIICGVLADRPGISPLIINNIGLTVGGVATMLVPHFNSYALFCVYSVIFGQCIAYFASLRSILIVELLGLNNLTNAFGLLCLFQGIATFFGGPLAGFLYDMTGSFNISFYVAGSLLFVSGAVLFPLNKLNRWEKRRNEAKKTQFNISS